MGAAAARSEEQWERLEQLRPLLHGIPMGVTLFDGPPLRRHRYAGDSSGRNESTRHLRE